jgi:hypothetical protein
MMETKELPPSRSKDYTHSYRKNCYRRYPDDDSPDILCFESGHYGLSVNTADLTRANYKSFDDDNDLSYLRVMEFENRKRMESLDDVDLVVEVVVGCRVYRAKSALCNGVLWEAGRIAQVS